MFKWIVDRINTDERLVDLRSQVYLLISSFLLVFAFLGVIRITMTSRRFVKKSVIMKEMRIYNDVTTVKFGLIDKSLHNLYYIVPVVFSFYAFYGEN
tara:strand:+ start:76 stop:366 length:291 start_codon:yes stop_codon:yes gene_type:complete